MEVNTFCKLDGKGLKIAIVQARFNRKITDGLAGGAVKALTEAEIANHEVFLVPGAFEIPLVCQKLAEVIGINRFDGIIAIGAVVKGETAHFEYVAKAVCDGLVKVTLDQSIPIAFGVLVAYDFGQAQDRAKDDASNKGYEAGMALVETLAVLKKINEIV